MNNYQKIFGITLTTAVTFLFSEIGSASPGVIYNRSIEINNCYAPPREPAGLLICGFNVYNTNYQYRIYCPNSTVRNITNGSWGQARTAVAEDNFQFGGEDIITKVVREVCI